MGFIPGSIVYFLSGIIAAYAAFILLRLYLLLDTPEEPLYAYSDVAERLYRRYGRRTCDLIVALVSFFQFLQQWFAVAIIIVGNAQGLQEIAQLAPNPSNVCYYALGAGFTAIGGVSACVKKFKHISFASNLCIWLNLFTIYANLGMSHEYPAYTNGKGPSGKCDGNGFAPSSLAQQLFNPQDPSAPLFPVDADCNGLIPARGVNFTHYSLSLNIIGFTNMIYAYAGANMFIDFLSEMKNPREFWKSIVVSSTIIITAYMIYGVMLYAVQGPYVANPGTQGINNYAWQTTFNSISVFTSWVAAVMYGQISVRVAYSWLHRWFGMPPVSSRNGTICWIIIANTLWWTAYIIGMALPQIGDLTSIITSFCVIQYTYTLPFVFHLTYEIQQDDTWREVFTRRLWLKALDFTVALLSLVVVGMGLSSSIQQIIIDSSTGTLQAFLCS
jgi:hypothetical protein